MPRGNYRTKGIDNRGYGSQGFCKLCAFKDGDFQIAYNERTRTGWTPRQLNDWAVQQGQDGAIASKETIYKHREHVKHPRDRIVTAVQKSQEWAMQQVPKASPDEFLETIVSVGAKRAMENPEDITIDHALRAAQALKQSSNNAKGGIAVLIGLVTGRANVSDAPVIDGVAVEVP